MMRDFKKYEVWVESMKLVKLVYEIIHQLPKEEKFGLASQISRSAVSIPSNIAEGSAKSSDAEFKRFLEIAIGSAFELETQFLLCLNLGFVAEDHLCPLLQEINKVQKQLNNLINKIKNDNK